MHTYNRIQGELVNNHLLEKGLGTTPCMEDAFDVIWQSCSIGHGGNLADEQWLVACLTQQLDHLTSVMKAMAMTLCLAGVIYRLDLSQSICLKLLI